MKSILTICRKELSDHLGSRRYLLLFALIVVLSLLSAYTGADYIRDNPNVSFTNIFSGSMDSSFSFIYLMVLFGPIIGLALGFDAINRERTRGSLSVILSQPIFRDNIITGKFLAGVAALALLTISTVGIITGVAIPLLGFGPGLDEVLRIGMFALLSILYLSIWLAVGLLFSTLTKNTTTSILASISTWLLFSILMTVIASMVANAVIPVELPEGFQAMTRTVDTPRNWTAGGMGGFTSTIDITQMQDYMNAQEDNANLQSAIESISPTYLYEEAAQSLLGVTQGGFGQSGNPFQALDTTQSAVSSWPQVTVLSVLLIGCFAASYMLFLRQEIRAGG
ncbi:MAG: ABC transporter permease [Candidatus Bathyarchaeota archaeon]|nr:MAG: ABC transporter permease [Candidatus Bathyarchaeota archaeon]